MRNSINKNPTIDRIMKVGKRIAITIVCCIPIVICFAYLTRRVITSNAIQILCFMAIFAVAVLIVELIARAREKRKSEIVEEKRDVFK